MKLFFYELKKTFASKILIAIVVICFGISIVYQWSETKSGGRYDQYSGLLGSTWQQELKKVEKMTSAEQKRYFEIESWYHGLLAAQENLQNIDTSLSEFEELYPDVDMKARLEVPEKLPDGMDHLSMHKLYNNMVTRIDYQDSYGQFREDIQQKADELEDLALFSDVSGFGSRNILQTAEAYKKLGSINLQYDYSAAIYMGTNTAMVDMMILFLAILVGWQIFCKERETGLYPVLQTTKNGGAPLIEAKVVAYFFVLAIVSILMYFAQFLFGFELYGVGNMNAALQSVPEYRNCVLKVTVGTYIGLFLLIKIVTCWMLGGMVALLMVLFRNFILAICGYFVFVIAEYLLYLYTDSLSKWNWFYFVNLFSIMDAKNPFTIYWNLNLFSYPIWVEYAKIIFCVGLIFFCIGLSIAVYCRERDGKVIRSVKTSNKRIAALFGGRHVCLFFHEGYKLYVLGGIGIFLIVLVATSIKMAEGIPQYTDVTQVQAYRYYIEQLNGVYTDEKRDWIEKENEIMQMTDSEALEKQEQFQNGQLSENEYMEWMDERQQRIEMRSKGFAKILEQEQTIIKAQKYGRAGFVDQYKLVYLFKDDEKQMIFACMILSILIIGVSGLVGIEERYGMKSLLQSTRKGRGFLTQMKLSHVFLCATVLYAILYVPYYMAIWRDLAGTDSTLVLSGIPDYQKLSLPLSIRQAFFIMFILRYFTVVICGVITAVITKLVKKQALGSIICFLLFLGPCILYIWNVNLSGVSVVGGILPQMIFQNGRVREYGIYWIGLIAALGIGLYGMRERN